MSSTGTAYNVGLRLVETDEAAKTRIRRAIRPAVADAWRWLNEGPVALRHLEAHFDSVLPEFYLFLQHLWANKALALCCPPDNPEIEIAPAVAGEVLDIGAADEEGIWKLSRFAFMRTDKAGSIVVETASVPVVARVLDPSVGTLLAALSRPKTTAELRNELARTARADSLSGLLFVLRCAGVVQRCDVQGRSTEDLRTDLMQWEFHDLLFHARSRQGRHNQPMGADFRFKGSLSPQPPVKPNPWREAAIPLPRPNLNAVAAFDPPFTAVLESRQSSRAHDSARPISLGQLSEFLYRTARIRYRYMTEIGEFTSRPYPSGGASYELELYLTINVCADLARGFYYYDPEVHSLSLVQTANENMEALLDEAWLSAARLCRPQVLITIASRFQRLSWKYSGMAYATQLKNVGVLYQTFYLVATAMNLAGCGLGLGNSVRFSRLAGTEYFQETSIGEFMLGTPA